MGIINRRMTTASAKLRESGVKTDFLMSFMPDIKDGRVIPIISNSFRLEQIFQGEEQLSDQALDVPPQVDNDLTIEEQLIKEWAESNDVQYPMPDKYNLARIAQYHLVETKDNRAKIDYINFLKRFLLAIAEDNVEDQHIIDGLNSQVNQLRFSEIVRKLDYPRFPQGIEDPMRLLARLPLPIYITTSYYDFLERALELEGKQPQTRVCFWNNTGAETYTGPESSPTIANPMVYHLFGMESHPQTLVISEDDYINFLVSIVEDRDTQHPIFPLSLQGALNGSRLLLLGYQLRDWDFRILFRIISKFRKEQSAPRGMIIQLKPDRKRIGDEEKSRKYLNDYFDQKSFHFEWTDTERFVYKLWDEWKNTNRQG